MANFIPKIEYVELGTGTPKTVQFDSPPEGDPLREELQANQRSKRSSSGVRQTQFNYALETFTLVFNFQSETVKDAFEDFFLNHAARGGSFDYYIHSDEVTFDTYQLRISSQKFARPIPAATPGEFEYDLRFRIERVL
jgi:hypothetical protein